MNGEDFSWRDDQECVAVDEQFAIAIYPNPKGNIVIRQEDRWGDDDDVVIVARGNVAAVCRALMEAAGIEPQPAAVTLLPSPISGAERQRKRRERQWRELLERHGTLCAYCGEREASHQDHVIPRSKGGSDSIDNMVPACADCNLEKGNRTPDEWRAWRAQFGADSPHFSARITRDAPLFRVTQRDAERDAERGDGELPLGIAAE
jgi:hypothetical protein